MTYEHILDMAKAAFEKKPDKQCTLENLIFLDGLKQLQEKEVVIKYCGGDCSQGNGQHA